METGDTAADTLERRAAITLAGRSIVFVGLMGAGKTTIGRAVAESLSLPFVDSDAEIETAARMTIAELFAAYGEPEFRALEERVIARIAEGPQTVLSTGGGAYMSLTTRRALAGRSIVVWLKADLAVLLERVRRRTNRPLLQTADPEAVLRSLMEARHPIYAHAEITISSRSARKDIIVRDVLERLAAHPHQDPNPHGP